MEDSEKNVIKEKKNKPRIKIIVILLIIIIVLSYIIYSLVFKNSSTGIIISAKSTFKKAIDTEELRTATFTYNGVAKKCKEECKNDGKDEYVYYVSYEGDVTAGIDFDEIDFKLDKEKKIMTIIMPEVKITDSHTYIEKQKFIFINDDEYTKQYIEGKNNINENNIDIYINDKK